MPELNSMGKALGVRTMIEIIKREAPDVEIGNFTRPMKRTFNTVSAKIYSD
jgi:hypothetical protein